MKMSSAARSEPEVKKFGTTDDDRRKSEEDDSYGDESFDEFQEDVRNILDCNNSKDSSESDGNVQRDASELQLIIDTLENTKSACSKTKGYNKTFSDDELRDIERGNSILMRKILSSSNRTSQYNPSLSSNEKVWNSAINRKKRQQEIDQHNLVLLKRIQAVKPFGLSHRK